MLDQLRRGASSWVAKLLMAILVVSFGVWGVGDMFTGLSQTSVAEVGGTDIPVQEFQSDYQRAVQSLSRQTGRAISPEQAVQIGIPQQVLGRLVTEVVMGNIAEDLGLGVSDDELVRQIRADPSFLNAKGEFDRARMTQMLAANDLTEVEYVETMRGLADRRQIADGLVGGLAAPTPLVEAVSRYQNQTRTVRYIAVTEAMAAPVGEPSAEALQAYFDANKGRFRAPEYRAFSVVVADPAKIADPSKVSDEDARSAYDTATGRFGTPERRKVQQIVYPDKASAEAAARRLGEGTDIATLVTERGLKEADVDLGTVAKGELIDPAVDEAAFKLGAGETAVVDGRFGPALVRVVEVVPAARQPFEEVAATIKQEIAVDRAERQMLKLYDEIEEARTGGATLADVARQFDLALVTVDDVDRQGAAPDGTARDVPQAAAVLPAVFAAEQGLDADPVEFGRNGFAWFELGEVVPARDRTLEEARPEVVAAWTADEEAKALTAKADEIAAKLRGGETLEAVATALGATVEAAGPFKRGDQVPGLSADAVRAAFDGGQGTVAATAGAGDERIVLKVETIVDPAFFPEAEEAQALSDQLSQAVGNGLLAEYVADRETAAGVSINQPLLMRAIGLDAGGNS